MKNKIKLNGRDLLLILGTFFTRDELRAIASESGVKRGRDKQDTINNLVLSGKHICIVGDLRLEVGE